MKLIHNILTFLIFVSTMSNTNQEINSSPPPHKSTGKFNDGGGYNRSKWGGGRSVMAASSSFKGALPDVGTFITGTQQATQYDEA